MPTLSNLKGKGGEISHTKIVFVKGPRFPFLAFKWQFTGQLQGLEANSPLAAGKATS